MHPIPSLLLHFRPQHILQMAAEHTSTSQGTEPYTAGVPDEMAGSTDEGIDDPVCLIGRGKRGRELTGWCRKAP